MKASEDEKKAAKVWYNIVDYPQYQISDNLILYHKSKDRYKTENKLGCFYLANKDKNK